MAVNAGGLKILAPTFGSIVVTLTTPAATTPVVYSDALLTATVALPVTITANSTQNIFFSTAGTYTLSVLQASQQIADPLTGKVQSFDIGPGEIGVKDYSGFVQAPGSVGGGSGLQAANNLSDVASAATARTNLGLGTAATTAASAYDATGAATAAQAAAITASNQRASNLSDVASATTARANLGLGGWSAATANLAPSGYLPSANGLLIASDDPQTSANTNTIGAGVVVLIQIPVTTAVLAAKLWYATGTASTGATAAQNFVGLYGNISSTTINLLGISADQSTNFGTGNNAFGAPLTVQGGQSLTLPAGSMCWAAFLFNGTTSPQFSRSGTNSFLANVNLTAPNLRFSAFGTAQTTLPLTINLASQTITSPFWAGIS